jgi:hypothetical protein
MGQSKNAIPAVPDGKPANEDNQRCATGTGNDASTFAAPDLGGSFEEHGQVRRHDGIGAAPGMQPVAPLQSDKAARETEQNSSAGS